MDTVKKREKKKRKNKVNSVYYSFLFFIKKQSLGKYFQFSRKEIEHY